MVKKKITNLYARFSLSDEKLMSRVQTETDFRAFDLLVTRWQDRLRQLCFRMTGDSHAARDMTQETFARLYAKRHHFKQDGPFSAYLRRIAVNLCCDELRRRRRMTTEPLEGFLMVQAPPLEYPERPELSPDNRLARAEEEDFVRQALAQLPEIYRAVIVLRHYENLKLRQVAEILEIPEGTVNSRMAEALVRLNGMLKLKLKDQTDHSPQKKTRERISNRTYHYATSPS